MFGIFGCGSSRKNARRAASKSGLCATLEKGGASVVGPFCPGPTRWQATHQVFASASPCFVSAPRAGAPAAIDIATTASNLGIPDLNICTFLDQEDGAGRATCWSSSQDPDIVARARPAASSQHGRVVAWCALRSSLAPLPERPLGHSNIAKISRSRRPTLSQLKAGDFRVKPGC